MKRYRFAKRPCKEGHFKRVVGRKGCPACYREYQKQWRRRRSRVPGYAAARRARQTRNLHNNPIPTMLGRAKQRAKRLGVPFDLSREDVAIPENCPALGLKLAVGYGRSGSASPSLDRIDPSKGYVKGNVAVISQRANQIKNDATAVELRAVLSWLEAQRG
jgi:hypothetical protein